MLKRVVLAVLFIGGVLAGGMPSSAQTFVSLSGSLADQTGAQLPGASLVLTNEQTRSKYEVQSGAAGTFEFVGLPSGDYALDVSLPGFRTRQERVEVVGRSIFLPLTLELGELEETMHVTARRGIAATPRVPTSAESEFAASARRGFQQIVERCRVQAGAGSVRLGGQIRPPRKILNANPQYPQAMADSGVGGTVRLTAIIGSDGFVRGIRHVNQDAHPDLVNAAVRAISDWEYDGTLLNCAPVEVTMHVVVQFDVRP